MLTGFQAEEVNDVKDDLTVLIDTKKYLELFKRSDEANCTENEVYQECGAMCVLGCRNASSSIGITLSADECEEIKCVKGCFCKEGLVRHRDKCIPATECLDQRSGRAYRIPADVVGSMKTLGLFKPQGCGPSGCRPQQCGPHGCGGGGVYIHNHNEATIGKQHFLDLFLLFVGCLNFSVD